MARLRPLIDKLDQSIRFEVETYGLTRHDVEQAIARAMDKLDADGVWHRG